MDNGLFVEESSAPAAANNPSEKLPYFQRIHKTFLEQYDGWQKMNLFERQWVFRDFKKSMGLSAEQALETLARISDSLTAGMFDAQKDGAFLATLKQYWEHQLKLMQGYEKNPAKLAENVRIIEGWIDDIAQFLGA